MDEQEVGFDTLMTLSVKELKDLLRNKKIDYSAAVEKSDLVKLLIEHSNKEDSDEKNILGSGVNEKQSEIVELQCAIVSNSIKPNYIAIVCHGFGANNADLASIGKHILQTSEEMKKEKWMFVFPNAVMEMSHGSYAWWPLDMSRLFQQAMTGQFDQMFSAIPPGLDVARTKITNLINHLKDKYKVPLNHFVIAGFSQGSMLAMDVAMHLEELVGGVIAFSSVLFTKSEWEKVIDKKKDLRVLQTHGTQDPVLVYKLGLQLKDFLKEHNVNNYEFVSFNGNHTISPECLSAATKFFVQTMTLNK